MQMLFRLIAVSLGVAILTTAQFTTARAVPFVVPGQSLTVDGSATFVGGLWQYRYTIRETLGIPAPLVRFIVNEHDSHAGVHHEANFLIDGGVFQFDFNAGFAGIKTHNYFWNTLVIPALGVITVGFDDVHKPGQEAWGIQRFGAHVETTSLLPVPVVAEPGTLTLLGIGLAGLALIRRRRAT